MQFQGAWRKSPKRAEALSTPLIDDSAPSAAAAPRPSWTTRQSSSVFAPWIAQHQALLARGISGQANPVVFTTWFYFRRLYPIISLLALAISLVTAVIWGQGIKEYLLAGASLSLLFGVLVLLSYVKIVPWRKHPSPLILYRTISVCILSAVIIFNCVSTSNKQHSNRQAINSGQWPCILLSGATQFAMITAEFWMAMVALDLLLTLTNPFTSYKRNLLHYQVWAWGFGIFSALALMSDRRCRGTIFGGLCWIQVLNVQSSCFYAYYVSWIAIFYLFALSSLVFGYLRLRKGLAQTLETRRKTARATMVVVGVYATYVSLLAGIFFVLLTCFIDQPKSSKTSRAITCALAYLFSLKGFVDASVWFLLHDFQTVQKVRADRLSSEPTDEEERQSMTNVVAGNLDIDLSPQLNLALRQEVLHYVSVGIIQAVSRAFDDNTSENAFMLEDKYLFKDYQPVMFQQLRKLSGISDHEYVAQFARAQKEKLSEGASGAFMFYSADSSFLVKTVTAAEAEVLHDIVSTYYNYLKSNQDSLLVRLYGSHCVAMYNQTFHFVVMKNVFPPGVLVNQRYDVKGSWINRNAAPLPPGSRAFCRHCNEMFIVGENERCPDVPRTHDANVILKDNDLTQKIRLIPEEAYHVLGVLNRDSELLCSLGITDYSLLIGVKIIQYDVDPGVLESKRLRLSVCSDQLSSPLVLGSSRQPLTHPSRNKPPLVVRKQNHLRVDASSTCTGLGKGASVESNLFAETTTPPDTDYFVPGFSSSGAPVQTSRVSFPSDAEDQDPLEGSRISDTCSQIQAKMRREDSYVFDRQSPSISVRPSMDTVRLEDEDFGFAARSVIGPGTYYLGVVDILQRWTIAKRLERLVKVNLQCKDGDGISCMAPRPFKDRFQKKMAQVIEHSIFIREVTGSWKGNRFKGGPELVKKF